MPTEVLKNNIQTTLLAAIDSNDAVITPTDPTGFPATGERARAAIGDEILIVAGGDGPQYDVTRGAEGTTAVGHAAGDAVRLILTAGGFSALAALGSALRVVTTHLSTAQLETLGDTEVDLVPGVPGSLLMGVSVVGQTIPGTVAFGSDPTLTVSGGASGPKVVSLPLSNVAARFTGGPFSGDSDPVSAQEGQPITVSADANPTVSGAILTSSLDAAGSLYAPGDTGTVDGGNNDATYVVDTVANPYAAIVGVNQGTKTFTVQGDRTATITPAVGMYVYQSTGNNGAYTVVSSTLNGGNTDVVTVEAIPDATVDGVAADNDSPAGRILTYTITDGGTGYVAGQGYELAPSTGMGANAYIIVDSIDPQTPDMEATFTVAYYVVPVA